MRRVGRLYDSIIDPENLKRAYLEARRGKTLSVSALGFRSCEEAELRGIHDELAGGRFHFGEYRRFTIEDPKRRVICAAPFRERVVHHAIVRVMGPFLERSQIFHSYACRRGKGTERALLQAFAWARSAPAFLKLDIRKYYDSIDHGILRAQLARVFKDSRLLELLDGLIDSYRTTPGKGLPIGNLTSQYFANHYLGLFDHDLERPGLGARYLRYMDDMLIFPRDRECTRGIIDAARERLAHSLSLELKPPVAGSCDRGIPFLGFLVFPDRVRLLAANKRRFRAKAAAIEASIAGNRLDEAEAGARAASLVAVRRAARCRALANSIWYDGQGEEP